MFPFLPLATRGLIKNELVLFLVMFFPFFFLFVTLLYYLYALLSFCCEVLLFYKVQVSSSRLKIFLLGWSQQYTTFFGFWEIECANDTLSLYTTPSVFLYYAFCFPSPFALAFSISKSWNNNIRRWFLLLMPSRTFFNRIRYVQCLTHIIVRWLVPWWSPTRHLRCNIMGWYIIISRSCC